MKKILLTFFVLSLMLLSGCAKKDIPKNTMENTIDENSVSTVDKTTTIIDEVSKHSETGDCWTIVNEGVYNITEYVLSNEHPGGPNISQMCGVDGTEMYEGILKHDQKVDDLLEQYKVQ